MPTELTFALFKYGLLVLLWLFVLLALISLKRDVTVLSPRTPNSSKRRKANKARRKRLQERRNEEQALLAAQANAQIQGQSYANQADLGALPAGANNTAASSTTNSPTSSSAQPTMLIVIDGPLVGTSASLDNTTITLGRTSTNTVVLNDEFASSHHAKIYQNASGDWILEDLGSTNGTVLNNQPVQGATILRAHQPVRIGATTFELR